MAAALEIGGESREQLRREALLLGFVACGFARADPLSCGPVLAEWLRSGRHGDMEFLGRKPPTRLDPKLTLSGAATVIVVAERYAPPPAPAGDWRRELRGRIAAYAVADDYHVRIAAKLERLGRTVSENFGGAVSAHVDGGPLVEKELARRAGLGWFGHNTNILTTGAGSYLLLGCLLTEASFAADAPFDGHHCGSCRSCVPACPTDALSSGPTIDARRCISYLTIEHRGPIDETLRSDLGAWVFGCDVCQEVCPWNAPATKADPTLQPYLPTLLSLDPEAFRERFAHTAIARTKRRGLARNAAIVLGNTGNPDAVEPLAEALAGHDEALVRAHAAWALGRLGTHRARVALDRAARQETVPPVLREIGRARTQSGRLIGV